jgi:hypothetical protein
MKRFQLAVAVLACCAAGTAMATPTPAALTYNLAANPTSSTGNTSWTSSNVASNYGNSYSWTAAASGGGTTVKMTAWGASTLTSAITTGWVGNYDPLGFGDTSQTSSELNANNTVNTGGPHSVDNSGGYDALMLTFGTAVTLSKIQAGYIETGSAADATVLEWRGAGDPTSALTSKTLTNMLCANAAATGCWSLVGDVLGMTANTETALTNVINPATASQYWMVGAYMALPGNVAGLSGVDGFKLNGFVATNAARVPEPASLGLFGIAGAALFAARRRKAKAQ